MILFSSDMGKQRFPLEKGHAKLQMKADQLKRACLPTLSQFSCQHAPRAGRVRAVPAGPWQPPPAAAGGRAWPRPSAATRGVARGALCSAGSQAGCVTPAPIALGLGRRQSQRGRDAVKVLRLLRAV